MGFYEKIQDYIKNAKFMRILMILIAEIELLFFGGIMYGLNSLIPVLKKQGYFHSKCLPVNGIIPEQCASQNQMVGYVLITGIVTFSIFSVPLGKIFDKFGHRCIKIVALIAFTTGCVFYALSDVASNYLLFPGTSFLAISSQSLMLCNLPMAELIPRYRNAIVSLLSGSFDSSAGVFSLIGLTYNAGLDLMYSFIIIGSVAFVIMLISILVYLSPLDKYKSEKPDTRVETPSNEESQETLTPKEISRIELTDYINKRYPTFLSAITSRYFIMQILYEMNLFFRFSFFFAQLGLQVTNSFKSESISQTLLINSNYFFIAGGLLAPIGGLLTDFFKNRSEKNPPKEIESHYKAMLSSFGVPLLISATMNTTYSILILFPVEWAFYLAFLCFTVTRAFLFSLDAGFIIQAFPRRFFGMIYGVALLISGSISFLQYGFLFKNFAYLTIVNYVLIGLSLWSYVHPIVLLLRI